MKKLVNNGIDKICRKCKTPKLLDQFGKETHTGDGHSSWCKECKYKLSRNWNKENPEYAIAWKEESPLYFRDRGLRKNYGITQEEYAALLIEQAGRCAICKQPEQKDIFLAVDHDHRLKKGDVGFIRGLLCDRHNKGLGYFNDDIELLKEAIRYLEEKKNA